MSRTKPTEAVDWAEAPSDGGDIAVPSPATRLDGYNFENPLPYNEFNSIARSIGRHLTWLGCSSGQFQGLVDAWNDANFEEGSTLVLNPSPSSFPFTSLGSHAQTNIVGAPHVSGGHVAFSYDTGASARVAYRRKSDGAFTVLTPSNTPSGSVEKVIFDGEILVAFYDDHLDIWEVDPDTNIASSSGTTTLGGTNTYRDVALGEAGGGGRIVAIYDDGGSPTGQVFVETYETDGTVITTGSGGVALTDDGNRAYALVWGGDAFYAYYDNEPDSGAATIRKITRLRQGQNNIETASIPGATHVGSTTQICGTNHGVFLLEDTEVIHYDAALNRTVLADVVGSALDFSDWVTIWSDSRYVYGKISGANDRIVVMDAATLRVVATNQPGGTFFGAGGSDGEWIVTADAVGLDFYRAWDAAGTWVYDRLGDASFRKIG